MNTKYHLVEAEEVDTILLQEKNHYTNKANKHEQQSQNILNKVDDSKKKNIKKKLAKQEKVSNSTENFKNHSNSKKININDKKSKSIDNDNFKTNINKNNHDNKNNRTSSRKGRGRKNHTLKNNDFSVDENGVYYRGIYVPKPDIKITAVWAREQIEQLFSSDNLVTDIFLRQHMDVEGYIPLQFIASFDFIYLYHQDYVSLLEEIKKSQIVQLDEDNETIRVRNEWSKWLWPNGKGGFGLPKYSKISIHSQSDEKELQPEDELS